MFVYLKSGHLTNQGTFLCPKGVRIREVPLYIDYQIETETGLGQRLHIIVSILMQCDVLVHRCGDCSVQL